MSILILHDEELGITPEAPMRIKPGSDSHYAALQDLAGSESLQEAIDGVFGDDVFDSFREAVGDLDKALQPEPKLLEPATWPWDTIGRWSVGVALIGAVGYIGWLHRDDVAVLAGSVKTKLMGTGP